MDYQKFLEVLRFIKLCIPSGVREGRVFSMTVAKNLGNLDGISYAAKDYPLENWPNHLFFLVFGKLSKLAPLS